MKYYRVTDDDCDRLVARADDGSYDLTSARPELDSYLALVRTASVVGWSTDEVAERLLPRADRVADPDETADVCVPISAGEVWAAGVTYEISEQAREAESTMPDVYREVYHGDRPEIFFKATPSRTVGPGDAVGIRPDSEWDVPEPELGVVLDRGDTVGYTVGNDVSSRSIEGKNPLYLPQAKVYDRCCSLGPCVVSAEEIGDPHDLGIEMRIDRDGEEAFTGSTSTAKMARTCETLVSYLTRSNRLPECAVLLTGTAVVPDESFTLRAGDRVRIDVEGVGTLENGVCVV